MKIIYLPGDQVTLKITHPCNKKYTSPREFVMITLLPRWYSGNAFLRISYFSYMVRF